MFTHHTLYRVVCCGSVTFAFLHILTVSFIIPSMPALNRFYKNADKVGKVLHVGTVVEGPSEYFSSRLSKKERKQTIVEEILGDKTLKDYSKRKYSEIQYEKSNKKKMFKTKKGKR